MLLPYSQQGSFPRPNPLYLLPTSALLLTLTGLAGAQSPETAPAPSITTAVLSVNTDTIAGRIDDKLYSQFLEHIYHSANGGLWGDIIWNRSFEEVLPGAGWQFAGGCLRTPSPDAGESLLPFGDGAWRRYEFRVEVRRIGGTGPLLAALRTDRYHTLRLALGADDNRQDALERVQRIQGQQQTEILASVPGTIETGRWYDVRLRYDGTRLQAWLDEKPILNETTEAGPEAGQVVVGARDAQAEFRNFQVMSLDGQQLFAGLPSPARHWLILGNAEVTADDTDSLNSQRSLHLISQSGEAGVAQHNLCVRRGDTCRGSLWLRGAAPAGFVVRLRDGLKTLAQQTLSAPASDWREYPLALKPRGGASHATLEILTHGKAAVWLDQVSLMPDSARATGGFRPDLLQAVAEIHPAALRWPGGSFVGEYQWKNAIGPQAERIGKRGWDEWDPLSLGVDEYIALCRKIGAEPLIVIYTGHMATPDLRLKYIQDAQDFVEYCNGPATSDWGKVRARNGHPEPYHVHYWEIDNEIWSMAPEDYVALVKEFVPAMKKIDPTIQTIACGSGQLGHTWGEGDIAVIKECAEVVDYLSIHHYENPGRFAEGPANAEAYWEKLAVLIAQSKNPHLKLFMSEWNAMSTDWRTGLYAGGLLNAFERNPIVSMATPALFLRHVSAPAWDNAFINFDQAGWFPAPNYVVMKLYRDHFAPDLLNITGDPGGLNATATKSADGGSLILKAVNPTDHRADVRLAVQGKFTVGGVRMEQVAPDDLAARNSRERPDAVRVKDGAARHEGNIVLFHVPRWSVAVVTITRRR